MQDIYTNFEDFAAKPDKTPGEAFAFALAISGGEPEFEKIRIIEDKKIIIDNIKKIILPVEKDDTDSIYCIKYGISKGYKEFLLLGATGSRADHFYANLALLKFAHNNDCTAVLKDSKTSIYYTENNLDLHCNSCTVSVFPFGCSQAVVSLNGFKYPADKLVMTSDFPIGNSNIATSKASTITVHSGGVLVIINHL